jgi:2-polyprenyl-6-methoxyphenol hydroxylase-like FAD-dependent oxidoreductase
MTPNLGQGGNSAIEGVAILVNELHKLLQEHPNPTSQQIDQAFRVYRDKHKKRVKGIFKEAKSLTRQHALDGFLNKLIALYATRLFSEKFIIKKIANMLDNTPTLDFIA